MHKLKLITAAPSTNLAISLDEATDHLHVTTDEYDAEIKNKIRSATRWCEQNVSGHVQHMVATWEWVNDTFPSRRIDLPLPPLHSIVSVKYRSSTGSTHQAFSSTNYNTETPTGARGWVELKPDESWPNTYPVSNAVKIQFKAGTTSSTGVSHTAQEAIKMTLTQLWFGDFVSDEAKDCIQSFVNCDEYGSYS